MYYSESTNHNLAYSEAQSFSGYNLSARKETSQHSLPHITQPILTKYRNIRPYNELIVEETTSFWCSLFGKSEAPQSLSMCKCQKTSQGHCSMVMKWINEVYDWKGDSRFTKAYNSYTRRNIELFLTDNELLNRLQKKLQILGVRIGQKHQATLLKICKNYLKHTIYYGKSDLLTRQNDLWMWFLIGIFYHIGLSTPEAKQKKLQQQIIFWSLDIIMNSFENLTRPVFQYHIKRIVELTKEYFPKWYGKLVQHYHIDLQPIIYEWTNQMMMGYMSIDSIGFYIDCLLKKGWIYVYKIELSYLEKRLQKMEHDQLFQSIQDKEVITRELMNCNEEWPLIFCNAATFSIQKQQPTYKP